MLEKWALYKMHFVKSKQHHQYRLHQLDDLRVDIANEQRVEMKSMVSVFDSNGHTHVWEAEVVSGC